MRYIVDKSYLQQRGSVWWYNRRIPKKYAHIDTRDRIRISLETVSLDEACILRNRLVDADDGYWTALSLAGGADSTRSEDVILAAQIRYQSAKARALAAGFSYRPIDALITDTNVEDVVDRLLVIRERSGVSDTPKQADAEALLGGAPEPKISISQSLEIYFEEIALNDQMYKSKAQKYQWRKVKKRSIAYFIEQFGDLTIADITREQALKYKSYWASRLNPSNADQKPISASTAARHIGNIRVLYREYFKHIGDEDRQNPFRNINFVAKAKKEVPPFPDSWVRSKILKPGAFKGLNSELQLIVLMLIETGCRPSEIINLQPEDMHINAKVPYIAIKARNFGKGKREIKTVSSEREIPLVGVALEAAKRASNAFPHYHDRNELFSSSVMKAFRTRSLFPTPDHVVYSFRHSFEKRMQEMNIDYGLRCLLMGHKTDRPAYGDGGSLSYRRDELLKIAHPYKDEVFSSFDAEHG